MAKEKPYYPMLEAKIAENGIVKKDIAEQLGISPRAFSKKLTGTVDFWLNEVLIIHTLFPDVNPLELFKHEEKRI